jgi:hypothetical protein
MEGPRFGALLHFCVWFTNPCRESKAQKESWNVDSEGTARKAVFKWPDMLCVPMS